MSRISKQIQKSRVDFKKVSDSEAEAVFVFKKDFIGFKGHFVDNPVLPGVCKIQAVLSVFSKLNGRHPELKEITSAKFFSRFLPVIKFIWITDRVMNLKLLR